jgi:hypothetical protein
LEAAKAAPWALKMDEWREMAGQAPLENDEGQVYAVPINITFTRDIGGEADLALEQAQNPQPPEVPPPDVPVPPPVPEATPEGKFIDRMFGKLGDGLTALADAVKATPADVVNVNVEAAPAPNVTVQPTTIEVKAPEVSVNIEPPAVNVAAPNVTVAPADVTVYVPPQAPVERTTTVERDARGLITKTVSVDKAA